MPPDDVREFLQDSQEILADSNQMWYISELGVALSHRGRKIAYAVTERCLSEANRLGGAYYVMRTAAKGSNSRHMFLRMGSTEISEVQDVSGSDGRKPLPEHPANLALWQLQFRATEP